MEQDSLSHSHCLGLALPFILLVNLTLGGRCEQIVEKAICSASFEAERTTLAHGSSTGSLGIGATGRRRQGLALQVLEGAGTQD